ncbi:hypothetical protein [Paraburkholderia dinghuensis]|uniref:Uncharacterized protein n=1 Tax=Paraburkholderia dinghuensis TaxID=2305225 RepID=A0A3N6MWF6_9BURK|nr:hypothetical protein [Paraburkholderia dinghuensis]RQH08334.1 hypothetical protein D1Y85_04765 [Paraburkholderia dinghuensis]
MEIPCNHYSRSLPYDEPRRFERLLKKKVSIQAIGPDFPGRKVGGRRRGPDYKTAARATAASPLLINLT